MSLKEFVNELHKSQEVPALLQSIETSASLTHPTSHALCQALGNSWSALSTQQESRDTIHPPSSLLETREGTAETESSCKQEGSGVGQYPPSSLLATREEGTESSCMQEGSVGQSSSLLAVRESVSETEKQEASVGQPPSSSSLFWAQVALNYSWEQLHSGHWKDVRLCWREVYALAALLKALSLCLVGGGEQQALVEIDKGILMGAPIMNNSLHNVAAMLSKKLAPDVTQEVGVATASDVGGASTMHVDSEVTEGDDTRRKIGKVKLRNYKPTPDSSERKRRKSSSVSDPLSPRMCEVPCTSGVRTCEVSHLPIIDMSRRIPVLHCPSLEEFHLRHMAGRVPVVISGALDHWPAYAERKWR